MRSAPYRFFLVIASILTMLRPACATSVEVRIDAAVPEVLRERVATMLGVVRPRDAAAALAATRILDGVWQIGGPLILRVEANCRDDFCMTVIAHVTETAIEAELILRAGKTFSSGHSGSSLWHADHPVWWLTFEGSDGAHLLAAKWNGRWVVEAAGPFDPSKRSMPEPSAPSPPMPFEVFRKELDSAR